jgi:hypothetical protein
MLPFKQFDQDLSAQLNALGLNANAQSVLSESRISEETYAPLTESRIDKSSDIHVSDDTLDRIEALIDTNSLSSDEAESVLEGLLERAPNAGSDEKFESIVHALNNIATDEVQAESEGSIEEALLSVSEAIENGSISGIEALRALVAIADAPVEEGLEDLRDEVLEGLTDLTEFRQILKKIKGVFKKVKVKKMSSADRAKSRASYRKRKAKIKVARTKKMKTAAFKKGQGLLAKARKRIFGESSDLAARLHTRVLAESNSATDEFDMVARIGRIFDLLAERVSDDVVEVMSEQYDLLRGGLYESESDLESACRPCIAIIAECMKDIEQGNC